MSNDTFELGEIAIYVGNYERWKGLQVTILSGLEYVNDAEDLATGETFNGVGYRIEIPVAHNYREVFAEPSELRKLPPPADDGRKVTTWEKLGWKPAGVNV